MRLAAILAVWIAGYSLLRIWSVQPWKGDGVRRSLANWGLAVLSVGLVVGPLRLAVVEQQRISTNYRNLTIQVEEDCAAYVATDRCTLGAAHQYSDSAIWQVVRANFLWDYERRDEAVPYYRKAIALAEAAGGDVSGLDWVHERLRADCCLAAADTLDARDHYRYRRSIASANAPALANAG